MSQPNGQEYVTNEVPNSLQPMRKKSVELAVGMQYAPFVSARLEGPAPTPSQGKVTFRQYPGTGVVDGTIEDVVAGRVPEVDVSTGDEVRVVKVEVDVVVDVVVGGKQKQSSAKGLPNASTPKNPGNTVLGNRANWSCTLQRPTSTSSYTPGTT